jgi:hypothetical protein
MQDPKFVQDGRVTSEGVKVLKDKLPHVDFSKWEADPQIGKVLELFTVESIVRFVERKLKS